MKTIDIEKINTVVAKFAKDRNWDQFHSIKNLSMALSVETSELVEIFQWLTEEESNTVQNNPKLKAKVEEEVSDIFIYLLRIAVKCGIDVEKSVFKKMEINSTKYPVDKSYGNATKYTDL